MNCLDFQQLISAALDQELTVEEQQILAEHLKICTNCSEFAKKLNEQKDLTSRWTDIQIPMEIEEQILNRTVKTTHQEKPNIGYLKGYYKVPKSLAWASVFLFLILVLNSIFSPLRTVSESEKVQKISPQLTKVQKIILTEKDVVKTYTITGK